jgi:thiamine pyrophosphokinase
LGKHIGIIPLKECSILTTEGLEWDVTDWPTEFGGQMSTSNLVKEDWVTIVTSKAVLFTIDLNVG